MTILGIDPGSRKTGYAVLDCDRSVLSLLDYGTISLTDLKTMPEKLVRIFNRVQALFEKFPIQTVAVEAGFYGKNAQSAYKLGYARSAAVLAAAMENVSVLEYSPRKVKQSVTGNGNASKQLVKVMVKSLLKLSARMPLKEDEADACAVAICHSQNAGRVPNQIKSWKEFIEKNDSKVVTQPGGR